METACDVCGTIYADESEVTLATTTYAKGTEELKVTEKWYCDFCLYQVPDFVKVHGDGDPDPVDPEEGEEVDITGDDGGTVEVPEDEE